jgi:hypothetical protein
MSKYFTRGLLYVMKKRSKEEYPFEKKSIPKPRRKKIVKGQK